VPVPARGCCLVLGFHSGETGHFEWNFVEHGAADSIGRMLLLTVGFYELPNGSRVQVNGSGAYCAKLVLYFMLHPIDHFFEEKDEPVRSCLAALRIFIRNNEIAHLTESWKYGMPFYDYNGKMLCYFWLNKMTKQPYIGFVDGGKMIHPVLIQEKRARMKIFELDASTELPVNTLNELLREAIALRKMK
jgi:hypothetical protein